jgi:xylose isomerase
VHALSPAEIVDLLGEVGGVHGVNFHDNDLIPIDATPEQADHIKSEFSQGPEADQAQGRDGDDQSLLRSRLPRRRFHQQRRRGPCLRHPQDHARHGSRRRVRCTDLRLLGRSRGNRDRRLQRIPSRPKQRFRTGDRFPLRVLDRPGYEYKFALEAKPNEPRGHMYFATTGHYLAFIPTLKHPDMVGVNPEVAHEHMAGLNFVHARRRRARLQASSSTSTSTTRNSAATTRTSASAAANIKARLLPRQAPRGEQVRQGSSTSTHTPTAHPTAADVIEFARGCMRTYLILAKRLASGPRTKKSRSSSSRSIVPPRISMACGANTAAATQRRSWA